MIWLAGMKFLDNLHITYHIHKTRETSYLSLEIGAAVILLVGNFLIVYGWDHVADPT